MTINLLNGIVILAVEQFGAGPFGTLHLADLGAEVIKIENPHQGGDVARKVPPYTLPDDSLYFQAFNRNKRSLTLDLKHPDGQRVFLISSGRRMRSSTICEGTNHANSILHMTNSKLSIQKSSAAR